MDLTVNWSNLIMFVITLLVFCASMVYLIISQIKIARLQSKICQLEVDGSIYLLKLSEMVNERDNQSVEQTEGFLKFVSESRDWAFEYIEDVQQALRAYDIALGMDDTNILNEAYKKLIDFLPKDDVVN